MGHDPTSGPALFGLNKHKSRFVSEEIGTYSSRKVCLLAVGMTAMGARELGQSLKRGTMIYGHGINFNAYKGQIESGL